jgi:cytochrome d ubiquinol oxidase subunit I
VLISDPALLSRIQFAFTVSFHIIFPSFSIGLATFLLLMETYWLKTKNLAYLSICRFYNKIFALTFGMGVVSGIVMEFQFGTNWPGFSAKVGPVLGSLFVYEVLTAFFIEAGFLGVMILGWERVGAKLHYLATCLVVAGVTISAFWIMSANSWMQVPAGAIMDANQVFHVVSWQHVILNPTVLPRFIHMLLSAYITTGFVILGISAYFLLRKQHAEIAMICAKTIIVSLFILVPLQIFMGDKVGTNVHKYQPIKTAAMEAVWHTQNGAPLVLFAYPNMQLEKNQWEITIPKLASLINTHSWNGQLQGLTSVPTNDRPFVPIVFYCFRVMVGAGILMLIIILYGAYLLARKKLVTSSWYLKLCVLCSPIGFIAIITGWFTAETGRQPWVVYNMLRTKDMATSVSGNSVLISLILLIIVYGIIFGVFYFKYLFRTINHGPKYFSDRNMPFSYMQLQNNKNNKA